MLSEHCQALPSVQARAVRASAIGMLPSFQGMLAFAHQEKMPALGMLLSAVASSAVVLTYGKRASSAGTLVPGDLASLAVMLTFSVGMLASWAEIQAVKLASSAGVAAGTLTAV